jgi:hypothetical protein
MIKWRLMLSTLLVVAVFIGLKLGLHFGLHFSGAIQFTDIAIVLTGGIFLIGFMLAGTMSDYKESEKLPGEIISSLEGIEDGLCHIAASKQNIETKEIRTLVMDLTDTIHDWLYKKIPAEKLYDKITAISGRVQPLDNTALGIRVQNELHALRKVTTRIDVIARTSFLQSGYALMDSIVALVLLLLAISKFNTITSEIIVCSFVSLIYVYMVRLIRDIDDPFEYSEGKAKGAAEVDLFPLIEFKQRLQKRI